MAVFLVLILALGSLIAVISSEEIVGRNNSELGGISFKYLLVELNASAKLHCNGDGGNISWTVPDASTITPGSKTNISHWEIDGNGTMTIAIVSKTDGGFYWCTRDNHLSTASVWHVMIDPWFRHHLEMDSITYGWYAGLGTLLLGVTVGIMKVIVRLCCPQCHARASAAARVQQMRSLIVSLETYRHEQAAKLWENYNAQVTGLKDHCSKQMEGLRDHYTTKITRFRNYRLPLGNFRDQYSQQVGRVREYSTVQMERLHDNYARNMGRLRTYSVVQLERFRQQYQLQHKHIAKILEAMNFNLENCRGGGDMTPGDSVDIDLNMEISLADLQMEPSDIPLESSDSFTIEQCAKTITVQVGVEAERVHDMDMSSLKDYMTPPTGGSPVAEGESEIISAGDSRLNALFRSGECGTGQDGGGDIMQRETSV